MIKSLILPLILAFVVSSCGDKSISGLAKKGGTPTTSTPSISFWTVSTRPTNGFYGAGEDLTFVLTYPSSVTVSGTPQLGISLTSGVVSADYVSGSGSTSLTFTYTVQAGDDDVDGIILSPQITLNGGSITVTSDSSAATLTVNPAITSGVRVDAVAPTLSLASPVAINVANQYAYPVSGTCSENGIPVQISVGGISASGSCSSNTFIAAVDASGLSDGAGISITADATDNAGNSAVQATATTFKDTIIPLLTLTSASDISMANVGSYTLSGTCSENGETVVVNLGTLNFNPLCSGGSWSTGSVDVSAEPDAPAVLITVDHQDLAGNPAVQATQTIVKDSTITSVTIDSPTPINNSNKNAYTLTGTCTENGLTVTVDLGGQGYTPTCSAMAWSTGAVDVSAIGDNVAVAITADHDIATQATSSVLKDTIDPTVTLNAAADITPVNVATYSLSGTCSENGLAVNVDVGGVTTNATCSGGSWSVTNFNVSAAPDNVALSITADHSDQAGNTAVQASTTVDKNTVVPTVTIDTPAIINNANKSAYTLTGTCSENTETVTVDIGGVAATPTCSSLTWSTGLIDVTGASDNLALAITADHSTAAQASTQVLKDTIDPNLGMNAAADITAGNVANYSVTGTCDVAGETVSVDIGGIAVTPVCNGTAWSTGAVNVSAAPETSSLLITADFSDAAGNTAVQVTDTVIKNAVIATVTIDAPAIINIANKNSYTLTGTCSDNGETVTIDIGGVAATPLCGSSVWTTGSIDVSAAPESVALAITADHADAVQAATQILKDTIAPTLGIDAAADITPANVATYPLSGTCDEEGATINIDIGGVATTSTCSSGTWTIASIDVSAAPETNSLLITADVNDAASNPAVQATDTVIKNAVVASVSIDAVVAITNSNVTGYTVTGTCSFNGQPVAVDIGGVAANPTCTTLTWNTGAVNVSAAPETVALTITADHDDGAGDVAIQASTQVIKDTILPTLGIDAASDVTVSNVATYALSGTCDEEGATVNVDIGGVAATPTCSSGTWTIASIDVSAAPDTVSLLITADVDDAVGNSAVQATTNVAKDSSVPTVTIDAPTIINNANVTLYSLTGTCSDNGETVVVDIGGVAATPVCTTLTWNTGAINVSAAAETTALAITADHDDAVGNSAVQASTQVLKDTILPTLGIDAASDVTVSNVAIYALSGTCDEEGATVNVDIGGVASTPTCSSGTWTIASIDVSAAPDTISLLISADVDDAAGNSAVQATTNIAKDTAVPTVTIDAPTIINNANKASYTLTGTCSENGETVTVDIGGVAATPTCSTLTWTTGTIDVSAAPESVSLAITADHNDSLGNSAVQATTQVLKDTILPTLAIDAAVDIGPGNVATYPLSGTCDEEGATINVDIGGVAATPTCSSGTWTIASIDVSAAPETNSLLITADVDDTAGNSAVQATDTVIKNALVADVSIDAVVAITNANVTGYTVTGTCSFNGQPVAVDIGGVAANPTCTTLTWNTGAVNVSAAAETVALTITADHDDGAGDVATQASTQVIKDTILPTLGIDAASDITVSNVGTYSLSGTCDEEGATVNVDIGGVASTPTCSSGTWTIASIDVSAAPDTVSLLITADVDDAVGNSAVQATTNIAKDTAVPTVTIDAPTIINNANKASYTLTGTCSENGETVTVDIGGVAATPTCSTLTWTTGTIDVTAAPESVALAITADHSDSVGNPAVQATTQVLKDTILPTLAIDAAVDIGPGNVATYPLSGTCDEEGATVNVDIGGVAATPTCSSGTWTIASIDVSAAPETTSLLITADVDDAAGNSAVQATDTVIKDALPASVSIDAVSIINDANKTGYTVTGTCSFNGQPVAVDIGGVAATPTCTTLTWTTGAINVTAAPESISLAITADHNDGAGDNAPQATTQTIKDTVLPTLAIDAASDITLSNVTTYALSGTCDEEGATVNVDIGGVAATPTCSSGTWTIASIDVSAAPDTVSLLISADIDDAAGNSAVQATTNIAKDTAVPTVTIDAPTIINNANKAAYTLTGTCSENGETVTIDIGGVAATPTCSTLTWTTGTIDVSAAPESVALAITADHSDSVGNPAIQATTQVLKDTILPTLAIDAAVDIGPGNVTTYPLSGTCDEEGATINVDIGGVAATPTCSSGTWTIASIDVSAAPETTSLLITADVDDAAGNSAVQATDTVIKDALPASVSIDAVSIINDANKTGYTITGTCSFNGQPVAVDIGGVAANPTCLTLTWTTGAIDVSAAAETIALAITADHNDGAGDNAPQATTQTIKDTILPTLGIDAASDITLSNVTTYALSGTCDEEGATVNVDIGGIAATPTCSSGTWTIASIDVSAAPDTVSLLITADVDDAAGNSAIQATDNVIKDATAPTVTIDAPAIINNANKAAYTLTGTCSENGETVTIDIGGVAATPVCSTLTWTTGAIDVTTAPDTVSLLITADHNDSSGNPAVQATTNILKDTVDPTVGIDAAVDITSSNHTSYTVTGTCSDNGETVAIDIGGIAVNPICGSGTWTSGSVDVSGLADTVSLLISADHTDAAGNTSVQATDTVQKDVVLPTVTIDAVVTINNANKAGYTVTGTCSENGETVSIAVGSVLATPTCSTLTWTTGAIDVSAATDSPTLLITADHSDALANAAIQATTQVIKDTVNPIVVVTQAIAINIANETTYSFSGTCTDNGETVTLDIGGVPATPVCTTLTWNSGSLDMSGVLDGPSIAITADMNDPNGNSANQGTASVLKDTIAATVAITVAPEITASNQLSYTISGTCSENSRAISIDVGGVTDSVNCASNAWTSSSLDVSGIADTVSILVTADHSDLAGNPAVQATDNVGKDTGIPTVSITTANTINNSNKTSYIVDGLCSEETRIVTVNVGGVVDTPACSGGSFMTAGMDVSGVTDGPTISVTADHSDLGGNSATQAITAVIKDTINPTVTITQALDIGVANEGAYTVSGACSENGETVTISIGGIGATPTCTSGSWTTAATDVSGLADGPAISITADINDPNGNVGTQASTSVVKDTTIPTVGINAPTAINASNDTAYSLTGTCSENGQTVVIDVGGVAATPVCTTLTWNSGAMDVSGVLDNAAISITVDHSDAANNAAIQATTQVLKDTVLPTIAINAVSDINSANATNYTVTGTCDENGQSINVNVGGVPSIPTCSSGTWTTGSMDVSSAPDTVALSITADISDVAGNSAIQATTQVVKDATLPTVTIDVATSISLSNHTSYSLSGTCSENTRAVTVSVGGAGASPTCSGGTWNIASIDVSGVADNASLLITANHSDVNGNNAVQASTNVIKDTLPATVTITSSPAINNTNKTAYTVSGTCSENGETVTIDVGGVPATPLCSTLTWTSGVMDVSGLADTTAISITADHADTHGNSATQAVTQVLKDTIIPIVTLDAAADIIMSNVTAYSVTGTCTENNSIVTISIGGVPATPTCTSGTFNTGNINVTAPADNLALPITVDQIDAAGNAAVQASQSVVKDTTLPSVAIDALSTINAANVAAYTISGTCNEEGRTVTVSVGGVPFTPTCTGGAWSTGAVSVAGAADNASLLITADLDDAYGNNATQATTNVLKDTGIPTVAIISAAAIDWVNSTGYKVTGSCSENGQTVSVFLGTLNVTPTCTGGAWDTGSQDVSAQADNAAFPITADLTDTAGNVATQAATTVLKDTVIPPPDTINLVLTGTQVIEVTGGTTTSTTMTATALDGTYPLSGVSLSVNIPGGSGITNNGPIVTDANGEAAFTITSGTKTGPFNLTVTDGTTTSAAVSITIISVGGTTLEFSEPVAPDDDGTPDDGTYDFGLQVAAKDVTFTVTNTGTNTSDVISFSKSGNKFSIADDTNCTTAPGTLAPNASCTVVLRFTPGGGQAGTYTGVVNVIVGSGGGATTLDTYNLQGQQ